jgi:hypothetical protein
MLGSKSRAKGIPEASLVWRTGQCPVHQGPRAELLSLGIFQKPARYNSPDCPVCTGQCPVLQRNAALELGSLGNFQRLLRYNSPDMSGVHQTVRCVLGATATSRQRLPATHLMRAQRAQKAGAPIPAHRTSRRAQKSELQRSDSNGTGDVAGAPDMSGVHRTVRCTIEQTAPPTVMFGGWGYKYPNHPTIHCIQVFPLLNHLQELGIQF